jgi:membrane protein
VRARHAEQLDSWLLIAATAVFVLTAERYFQQSGLIGSGPPPDHRNNEANSPETSPAGAAMQPGHGRRSRSPFAIP